jgi:uncharacterized protein YjbI with pentapeptide repeats
VKKAAQVKKAERRAWLRVARLALLAILACLIAFALWKVPQWQVRSYRARFDQADLDQLHPIERVQYEKDLIATENNARVTLAQIVGGIGLLSGLYLTWRNIRVTEEGKLTERFSKAVELLGSKELDSRMGGIYALERIAKDSRKDHWTVMEVLTAFVRERRPIILQGPERPGESPERAAVSPDIQAVLTVIGRRKSAQDSRSSPLSLVRTDLGNTDLAGADFNGADFRYSNLSGANLEGANLSGANLEQAKLDYANLERADLSWALIAYAKLTYANLFKANLNRASLSGADLSGAQLRDADLSGAILNDAILVYADLMGADFSDAYLSKANLSGARFSDKISGFGPARHLTWDQLGGAILNEETELPPYLEKTSTDGTEAES